MADPITREQVERAIEAHDRDQGGIADALGGWHWEEQAPDYVREGWRGTTRDGFRAALTRWHDELAAAEPVRRVARWDADADHYVLTPPYTHTYAYVGSTTKRETAIAWGYEIEGGPASAPAEDSPERLRERRERLGLSMSAAASLARINMDDVDALEGTCRRWPDCDRCGEMRPAYAAALSAEEARRAARFLDDEEARAEAFHAEPERPAPRLKVGDLDPVLRETARRTIALLPDLSARPLSGFGFNQLPGVDEWRSGKLTSAEWADQLGALLGAPASPPAPEVAPAPLPERPAPRFKVGEWVRDRDTVFRVAEMHWDDDRWYARPVAGVRDGIAEYSLQPASPPAPEVVDVPQPIVKRLRSAEAQWCRGETVMRIEVDESGYVYAPLALLRAMLADIDAQQGGAS